MFAQLTRLTNGKQLPMVANSSATGENVLIERGKDGCGEFYKLTTTQSNGWHRVNTYYANGTCEETYEK